MINQINFIPEINRFSAKNSCEISTSDDAEIIRQALICLEKQITHSDTLNNAQGVRHYLQLNLAQEKNEVFSIIFLDCKHRVLAFERIFYGTINTSVVYPRVVVQKALSHNAESVIFAHNHPSGELIPSTADIEITKKLKSILAIIDVEVLDHFIVSVKGNYSFSEAGLL